VAGDKCRRGADKKTLHPAGNGILVVQNVAIYFTGRANITLNGVLKRKRPRALTLCYYTERPTPETKIVSVLQVVSFSEVHYKNSVCVSSFFHSSYMLISSYYLHKTRGRA
jgi:hypothetical protein